MIEKATGNARISGSLSSLAGLEKAIDAEDQQATQLAIDRILMLHAIILSYGGIPMLYMGDEIGMTNDYSYLNIPQHAKDNRWMHRPRFDQVKDARKHKKGTVEHEIYVRLTDLIRKRKTIREFADRNDILRVDSRNERVFAYIREDGPYRTICVFNLNDHPEPFYLDIFQQYGFDQIDELYDVISSSYLDRSHYNLMLKPYQSCWIHLKSN